MSNSEWIDEHIEFYTKRIKALNEKIHDPAFEKDKPFLQHERDEISKLRGYWKAKARENQLNNPENS